MKTKKPTKKANPKKTMSKKVAATKATARKAQEPTRKNLDI